MVTQATAPAVQDAAPSRAAGRWSVLAVALAGAVMAVIDVVIVNVAIPSIRTELHAGLGLVELVVSAYTVTYASLLVIGGRLGDMYGRRRLFLTGLVVFTAASAACGAAPVVGVLVAARAAQGIGAALLYPQVLALVQVTFTGQDRARALGVFGAVIGLGAIAGQLLGGLLLAADVLGLGWRPVFLVNVPLGVLTIVAARLVLPGDRPDRRGDLDWAGAALASATLALLVVPLLTGRDLGWPLWTVLSLGAVLPAGFAFVVHERAVAGRRGDPLVRMDLFGNRGFAVGVPIAALFTASYAGFLLLLAVYLQIGLGYTPLEAALTYTQSAVGFFAASLLAPRVARLLGRHVLTGGYLLAALGLCAAATTIAAAGHVAGWQLGPSLLVAGIGQGLGMTPLIGVVIGTLSPTDAGAGAGVVTTTLQVGNALGVALLSMLFFGLLGGGAGPAAYGHAYALVLPVLAGLLVVAAVLATRLPAAPGGTAPLERLPGWATGFGWSVFLMTGGRMGDGFFHALLDRRIHEREQRIHEAPGSPGEFLAYQFRAAGEDGDWLRYLSREALAYGHSPVPHEPERRPVLASQVDEVRRSQAAGLLPADLDPALLRLMAMALANYPYLLPQITRMTTGRAPDDPAFEAAWTGFLRDLGRRLAARAGADLPHRDA